MSIPKTLEHKRSLKGGPYQQLEVYQTVVEVSDAKVHYDPEGKPTYVDYLVECESSQPHFKGKSFSVRRRYNDFAWLMERLSREIFEDKGAIPVGPLPPLPETESIFGWFSGERFTPEFIHKRQRELHEWLNHTVNHDICAVSPALFAFLSEPDLQPTIQRYHSQSL